MKKMISVAILIMLTVSMNLLGQKVYPFKSIYTIQYRTDLDLKLGKDASLIKAADTIETVGAVVLAPRRQNGRQTFYRTNSTVFVLVDTAALRTRNFKLSFIYVNNPDSSVNNAIGSGSLQLGDIVKIKGKVSEFNKSTQILLLDSLKVNGQATFQGIVDIIGSVPEEELPKPFELPVTAFNKGAWVSTGTSTKNFQEGEYWESSIVKLKNLKVVAAGKPGTGGGTAGEGISEIIVQDALGNQILLDDPMWAFRAPYWKGGLMAPINSVIDSVVGYVGNYNSNGMWTIAPIEASDIYLADNLLPNVTSFSRDKKYYAPEDSIGIDLFVIDADGLVDSVWVYYRYGIDDSFTKLKLKKNSENSFSIKIPPANLDSALVETYIEAMDNRQEIGRTPSVGSNGIWVLNHEPSIQAVQFTTKPNGDSFFLGDSLTLTGVVTSSSKNLGDVHIQNGSGPWSGIQIYGSKLDTFKLGDLVTIKGKVDEFNGKTELKYASFNDVKILETHDDIASAIAALPEPTIVDSDTIKGGSKYSEWYEGVFVQLNNVYVVNTDVEQLTDGSGRSRGEVAISEDSTATSGLRVDDNANYVNHNLPFINTLKADYPLSKGDSLKTLYTYQKRFDFIRGIFDYRNFNFKLEPRDSSDFQAWVSHVGVEVQKPMSLKLEQNYPNPFNPATTIRFSLNGNYTVNLTVYNIIGQKVATIVNNENLSAKTYTFNFNASGYASGIYFYKLSVDNRIVETRKMILIK